MKQNSPPKFLMEFIHLVLIFVGNFPICYGECVFTCLLLYGSIIRCAIKCLEKCYIFPTKTPQLYYRNLGCAVSNCAKYGILSLSLQKHMNVIEILFL